MSRLLSWYATAGSSRFVSTSSPASAHAKGLAEFEFSKPDPIYTDCSGALTPEPSGGRFHSSLAFRPELLERIGGWPNTRAQCFDLQIISLLHTHAASQGSPYDNALANQYVYGWATGSAHGQWCMSGDQDSTEWYDRAEQLYTETDYVGKLIPRYDARTMRYAEELGISLPNQQAACGSPDVIVR